MKVGKKSETRQVKNLTWEVVYNWRGVREIWENEEDGLIYEGKVVENGRALDI